MAVKPQIVELHIEELVLDGFSRRDRFSIADAVERELTRLIAEQGLQRPASVESVDGGRFKTAPAAKPHAIGAQVANSVYRGLSSTAGKGSGRP
ncbi:MAG TPA: hypothetical protein VG456_02875 [Candidatus Sulfopaludibacter sp.]|jgi:hypothetical protein|nr:hypothetical protein [Candidatus Sulfopaludibacter sp.]